MKNTVKTILAISLLLIVGMTLQSCNKDEKTGSLTVRMKDAPVAFDSVNVEVKQVMVHVSNTGQGNSGWIELATNAGVYNLLELQNNVTAVLVVNNTLPVGKIEQMRLILGDNNSVVVEGVNFPLELSSQANTGLKFNVNTTIGAGDQIELLIDFDAEKSIVIEGNTTFKLKPVISVAGVIYL